VSVGGISLIVYQVFKYSGERWLNAKFEERLAAYKHAQQQEIERLRFKINALMDRTTKLHEREFDVLPETWARLNDAYWASRALTGALQQYPDVNQMKTAQMEEFLGKSPLAEWEKEELRKTADKTRYYMDRIGWHRFSDTQEALREFQIYFLKNGIFIPPDVKRKFQELSDLIRDALIEYEIKHAHKEITRMHEKMLALSKRGPEVLESLEIDVQGRLWSSQTETL